MEYFEARGVTPDFYKKSELPLSLKEICLSLRNNARILDFGCGFGQNIENIKDFCQKNSKKIHIEGIDICDEAIHYCSTKGLLVQKINDIFLHTISENEKKFDLIIISHVLEHIHKDKIIPLLRHFREKLLRGGGELYICVPNAQSHTGCYWAYEDFTHETLFTTGSLLYVLKMSGFNQINFIDLEGINNSKGVKKILKKFFLELYKANLSFWNKVTSSSYHKQSPQCFCYEIKVLAKNSMN